MRQAFADAFRECANEDESLCIVVADMSPAAGIDRFRQEHPQRFINVGVAEQLMVGAAAGMAIRGLRPFCYTIATFAIFRPYEFIRNDLCYQNLPVTVVGVGAGVSYSHLGATHHAMEDIPLACNLPNMTVLAPCDPYETREATQWCAKAEHGPVYLRLGRAGEPDMCLDAPWVFGKWRCHRYISSAACVISYGPIMSEAAKVADHLNASLFSAPTLKPIIEHGFGSAPKYIGDRHSRIIVIEESMPYLTHMFPQAECFHLQDAFHHVYGTREQVLRAHGLTAEQIIAKLEAE